jgi:hypothetical protein
VPSPRKIKAILRDLPPELRFQFYEDIGKPTGQESSSLLDFCCKLGSAQSPQLHTSLTFHMRRGDFAVWIKEAVGDSELATKISKINPNGSSLENRLHRTVDARIKQLKDALMEYSIVPEDQPSAVHLEPAR